MAELTFLLTDAEYSKLKRKYNKLCRYVGWHVAAKHGCHDQVNSIKRAVMQKLTQACVRLKQKGKMPEDYEDENFVAFCKEVIWQAQKALSGKVPGLGGNGEEHRG